MKGMSQMAMSGVTSAGNESNSLNVLNSAGTEIDDPLLQSLDVFV